MYNCAGKTGVQLVMEKNTVKEAFKASIPVMAGYLILGMGFGMIMSFDGWSSWLSSAMSLFIYAGSMQYAAIGLFSEGASYITVALTALIVNARHIFYGISMLDKYKNAGRIKPYLIFALTDETYSLLCSTRKGTDYCLAVTLIDHIYWVGGTVIGALLGNVLSFDSTGMDFALTALFVTVFLNQWLDNGDHPAALTGLIGSAAMLFIFGPSSFLIPSMILIVTVLLNPLEKEERK